MPLFHNLGLGILTEDHCIMDRRTAIKFLGATIPTLFLSKFSLSQAHLGKAPFNPDWRSLENYQVPEWFRDAKFGIWAHWGPQ